MAFMSLNGIDVSYDKKKQILKGLNLEVEEGELVSLLGPSGCGKSTTLRVVAGFIDPQGGTFTLDGEDMTKVPVHKRQFGLVFQSYALFPHLSVYDNVAFGLRTRKMDKDVIDKKVKEILEVCGLTELADRFPKQMSGGQRQRVGVARAFATDSDLILMDEPFSALDPLTREELQDEIVKLQKEYQKTIVFVTHDMDEAIKCADKICFIQNGTVIQFDKTEEILRHPANDYVEKFVGKNRLWGNPKYIHASDIMCKEPYTLSKDRTVIQALQVMRQNAINSIFITEGKSRGFLGIVWLEDLSKLDVQHMSASIGDMISSDYVSVYEESSLQEIIDEIDYYKSGIIPVLNERRELKGALTKSILLSTLSKRYKKEQEG